MSNIPDLRDLRDTRPRAELAQTGRQQLEPAYKLKIHNLEPEDFIPNGDRYVVEQIEFEEEILFGSILVVSGMGEEAAEANRKPWEKGQVEARGVFPAVICTVGNGHLLGLPDWGMYLEDRDGSMERIRADVPMFFKPGDVVLVDYNAKGRNLRVVGRSLRIVDQMSILTGIPKIKLQRVDGQWKDTAEDSPEAPA